MEKKVTKKVMFGQIIEDLQNKEDVENREEKIAFLEKLIEQLEKKKGNSTKRDENMAIADAVYAAKKGQTIRASELINCFEGIENTSKATAVLGVMVDTGRAETFKEKGTNFYHIL